jgi:hypothetical protein
MSVKIIAIQKDYDQKETGEHLIDIKTISTFRETNICCCTMGMVSVAIKLVAYQWDLRPNRAKEFKIIKRIVVNSVLNN